MLQKELAKRLKARYDTKMDGNEWLEVSSDGIPLCRIKYNGQFLSNADQNLSDEYRSKIADIQDEISTVREYVGLYEHAPQMKAADVSDYRQLAAFGDTVLAATYSEKNGFMFCTWKQNADGDSVFWGDYSPNYEYVKEAFAVRSGLVSKDRLFSENESAYLGVAFFLSYFCEQFFLIANAVTFTFQIIVTGKPLIEEGCHITGFFLFDCFISPPSLDSRTTFFLRTITSRFNYTAPDSHLSAEFAKDSWFSFTIRLHESQQNCSKGICAVILEYRLYNERPAINMVGRCFFQRIFTCFIFFAFRQFVFLHSNPFQ